MSLICKYAYLMRWVESVTFDDFMFNGEVYMPERFTLGDLVCVTMIALASFLFVTWWRVPLRWLSKKEVFHCGDD